MYKKMFPNVEFGKTYYTRKNNMVKAMRVRSIEWRPGNYSNIICDIAGEGCQSFEPDAIYETIDDCIKGVNALKEIDVLDYLNSINAVKILQHRYVVRWKWDGFKPVTICLYLNHFLIYANENCNWTIEPLNKDFYATYETYEDCLADNHIKVVEF